MPPEAIGVRQLAHPCECGAEYIPLVHERQNEVAADYKQRSSRATCHSEARAAEGSGGHRTQLRGTSRPLAEEGSRKSRVVPRNGAIQVGRRGQSKEVAFGLKKFFKIYIYICFPIASQIECFLLYRFCFVNK